MRISIIIPCYHDEAALAQLALQIAQLHEAARFIAQVIVVDGAQRQSCAALCQQQGFIYCTTAAGRGIQQLAGAECATGDVLWFVHSDAQLPRNALQVIAQAVAAGATGGYFRFSFYPQTHWWGRALATLIQWRSYLGVPYGDQGLFFTQQQYHQAQGHQPIPLFEEVRLVKRSRRQGSWRALDAPIGVSTRRWQRDGWLKRTLYNRLLALGFVCGISAQRLAQWYYGK